MNRIGKKELIEDMMARTGMNKKDATAALTAYLDCVKTAMQNGDKVVIPDFGSFEVQEVKARMGRNVRTKEPCPIPAHKRVKFKPGKGLSDTVR